MNRIAKRASKRRRPLHNSRLTPYFPPPLAQKLPAQSTHCKILRPRQSGRVRSGCTLPSSFLKEPGRYRSVSGGTPRRMGATRGLRPGGALGTLIQASRSKSRWRIPSDHPASLKGARFPNGLSRQGLAAPKSSRELPETPGRRGGRVASTAKHFPLRTPGASAALAPQAERLLRTRTALPARCVRLRAMDTPPVRA